MKRLSTIAAAMALHVSPALSGQCDAAMARPIWPDFLRQCIAKHNEAQLLLSGVTDLKRQIEAENRQLRIENAELRAELDALSKKFGTLARRADAAIDRNKLKKRRKKRR